MKFVEVQVHHEGTASTSLYVNFGHVVAIEGNSNGEYIFLHFRPPHPKDRNGRPIAVDSPLKTVGNIQDILDQL